LASRHLRYELLDLKRHYRAVNALHQSNGNGTPAHEPIDAASSWDELEEWCEFHRKIDELPTEEREVVDLHFYQGLTKAEVAELLGVHVRTIQRLWNSALHLLHRVEKLGT
jgi:RNA polymerase sigma factor (sigma-70 family)